MVNKDEEGGSQSMKVKQLRISNKFASNLNFGNFRIIEDNTPAVHERGAKSIEIPYLASSTKHSVI
mgnify:CR=1 FL=1|jgi:hypothetical protein